jgi:DNA helicase-2/ATP-dependent DNA helicase PcrA
MTHKEFQEAYAKLNTQQQKAVNHIYGPMLVVAGPGTGKTELLAIRVGQILQKTDAQAHNILCLTFTDAGAYAMRSRLLKYIGPDAYQVGIYTYHSFCNQVIQENIEYFGGYRELQPISDLERVDVMRKIMDDLPDDHVLKRLKGDIYWEKSRLENLFENMKKENWTEEDFKDGLDRQKTLLLEDEKMYYTKKYTHKKKGITYQAGDLKEDAFNAEMEKYEKTYAASQLLKEYNKGLAAIDRFDYQDMILWVIDRFRQDDDLLGKYQERFQFILLDEYQDTNGAQNDLVFQLSSFWDTPNLFAVGDDDQSIYRFQGANMNNIKDFVKRFSPEVIVLEENYRSDQPILDASKKVIEYNKERLVNEEESLSKDLRASRAARSGYIPGPSIARYRNPDQEEAGLIQEIENLIQAGIAYKDIAVIYKEHKDVDNLVKYFSGEGIPINVKKKVNILELPMIRQLLNILNYIKGELDKPHSEEGRLFEMLHYPYMRLRPVDLASISVYASRRTDEKEDDLYWRKIISDESMLAEIGLHQPQDIYKKGLMIERWMTDAVNDTLQVFIEKIITTSGWLNSVLKGPDKKWNLQVFNTFFNLVKDESSKQADYDLNAFLESIEKMKENTISVPIIQSIVNENGIHFVTAHSSKGLEFKYVFLIKLQKSKWVEKNANRGYKYPYTLVPVTEKSDIEDDRRLFYVAMTRAEDGLQMSFSDYDLNEKESEAATFIYETDLPVPEVPRMLDEDWVTEYLGKLMMHRDAKAELIDKSLLEEILKDFKVSATSLNKYLKCPLTFYFENILRVPMARTTYLGFGNGIHYALEHYFREVNAVLPDGPLPAADVLIGFYEKGMKKYHSHFNATEYQNHLTHGTQVLKDYYEEYHSRWLSPKSYKLEHVVDDVSYAGIPIKGKLDKLIIRDHKVEVIDYKTGKFSSDKLKPPLGGDDDIGGDYWRQIVFYKFLIDSDKKAGYIFGQGTMDFVEKLRDRYYRKTLDVAAIDEELVREQLVKTYKGIQNHDFPYCKDEKCKWCNFVNENETLVSPLSDSEYEGEE